MYRRGMHINWYVLILNLTGFLVSIFAHSIVPFFGINTNTLLFENLANVVFLILVVAVPSVIYFRLETDFNEFKTYTFNKIKVWQVWEYAAMALILWCSCTLLNSVINGWLYRFGFEHVEQLERTTDTMALLAGFVSTCIVAPLTEEFFYRGVLVSGLMHKGKAVAVILSSFLFALAHGSVTIFAMPFVYGIVFSLIAIKTKSLLPSIIMHSVCNIISWIILNADLIGINMAIAEHIVEWAGIAGIALMLVYAVKKATEHHKKIPETIIKSFISFTDNLAWVFVIIIYIFDNLTIHGGLYG